jgi:excinuclease UvrABC nuclease subunit
MIITKYCVYRYIDKKTKEIMYIGKTNQLFVTNRIDQHKTDNVGIWANKNEHYIEFIELPREDDMNYLESYLIRKYKPKLNIVLSSQDSPPFELLINENQWKNLEKYLKEKEDIIKKPMEIFSSKILGVQESNRIFAQHIENIVKEMSLKDKHFIKRICFCSDLSKSSVSVSLKDISGYYNIVSISDIQIICNRFISYTQESRIVGTYKEIKKIGFFNDYIIKEENIIFSSNPYLKKFLERL